MVRNICHDPPPRRWPQQNEVAADLEPLLASELRYNTQRVSRAAIVRAATQLWAAMPDVRWQLEGLITQGARATSRWTITGTHTGSFHHPVLGRAPVTGVAIRVIYTLFCRIEDGRIVDAHDLSDQLGLFRQPRIPPVLDLGEGMHRIGTRSSLNR